MKVIKVTVNLLIHIFREISPKHFEIVQCSIVFKKSRKSKKNLKG